MNWNNVDLNNPYERNQNFLSGYDFETLLLEIETNLSDEQLNETDVLKYAMSAINTKAQEAKDVIIANIGNIMREAKATREIEQKPSNEQWVTIMAGITKKIGVPSEIPQEFGRNFFDHFLECLPPVMFSNTYTLCSEPYTHDSEGKNIYIGIFKKDGKWFGVLANTEQFKNLI